MASTNSLLARGKEGYRLIIHYGSYLQSFVLLLIRLAWGWQLYESGYAHMTDIAGTIKTFRGYGVPLPQLNVYISGSTELIGGILLMVGLGSRLISIPVFINFCVAYLTAGHYKLVHVFSDPDRFINDDAFPFLVTGLLILAFGPGKISVDYLLKRFVFHEPDKLPR